MEEMNSTRRADDATCVSLVEKCQENGWLRRGGYDWQDDPYLEEYPYEFAVAMELEDLRRAFAHGNWAIRQGFIYDDLAFIQQVDGGDEWWTLKRVADNGDAADWVDFESWTFGPSASYGAKTSADHFTNIIRSMQMATPEQCKRLTYTLPDNSLFWDYRKTEEIDFDHIPRICRSFYAETGDYKLSVYERPNHEGFTAEILDTEGKRIIDSADGIGSALDAARSLQEKAELCTANNIHEPRRFHDMQPLGTKAQTARQSAHGFATTGRLPDRNIPTI